VLAHGSGVAHAEFLETRVTIEELAVDGEYESAFELGDELLTQAEQEFGATSNQLIEAHLLLASLYRRAGNFDDNELHLLRATAIIEARDGAGSPTLIEPLLTLGDSYFAAGDYARSISTFEEARTIGRRAEGLLNFDQIEILARMSAAALLMDDYRQARALQYEALGIVQRTYGADSIEFLDAELTLAGWFTRRGQIQDAWNTFDEIDRLFNLQFADDAMVEIRILRAKAALKRVEAQAGNEPPGSTYLVRPVDLRNALDLARDLEEPNPLLEAEILRDIGDWNVAVARLAEIAWPYEQAWAILESIDGGFRLQQEWFGGLTLISAPQLLARFISNNPEAPWGRIEIAFALDTRGQTGNIRITQSDTPGPLDERAIRQIELSRFRPRMDDSGRLIASEASVGYDFRYDPASIESVIATETPSPAAE
jgi:tetratricopeptide (TPR) repeat protein